MSVVGEPLDLISKISVTYVCGMRTLSFDIKTKGSPTTDIGGTYFLSNNVGIHFLFTYYFPIRSFRLVPMFSGSTPKSNKNLFLYL
jgi:hypothetical protein